MFGANINSLDGNNKTPLDLVVGPYRFLTRQESGFTLIDVDSDEVAVSPTAAVSPRHRRPFLKSQPSFTDDEIPTGPLEHSRLGHSRSATTAFTSLFAKSGNIDEMAKLLVEHGGERGNKIPQMTRRKVMQTKPCIVEEFQDMIAMEPKEGMLTPSRCHKLNCTPKDDWTTKIATLNYEIRSNIEKKLLDIQYPLSQHPDEAMAVGIQMKELKMLCDAGSRILFLDGGGMRGLVQIEILSQLEEQTGRRITELFDWIVGTSTGGIVALALIHGMLKNYPLKVVMRDWYGVVDCSKENSEGATSVILSIEG